MVRFSNLQGQNYNPDTLRVYKSRVGKSLEDFFRYKKNPANFKMPTSGIVKRGRIGVTFQREPSVTSDETSKQSEIVHPSPSKLSTIDIPIALRPSCIIQINGLPVDLKEAEAKKISNVIMAMISVSQE